jgi:hypothetical protein
LSDTFHIKNGLKEGDALSPLLLIFAVEYAIRRVQANQEGLKWNGTHQLPVYAVDVNILGESMYTIQENIESLVVASKEIGLEVNAEKTTYMVTSCEQNAGEYHSMKMGNKAFQTVGPFKYLRTTRTNQNFMHEETKSRLNGGNVWYHSVQNLSYNLLSKNIKIKIYRSIIWLVLSGYEIGILHWGKNAVWGY